MNNRNVQNLIQSCDSYNVNNKQYNKQILS